MSTIQLNGKDFASQTSSAEPVIASTVTGGAGLDKVWTEIGSGNIVNNATTTAGDDGITWATDHDYDLIKAYVWNLRISETDYNGYFIPRIGSTWRATDLCYVSNRYSSNATTRTTVSNAGSATYVYALAELKSDRDASIEFTIMGGNLDVRTPIHWRANYIATGDQARTMNGTFYFDDETGKVTGIRLYGASSRTFSSTNEYIVLGANT